MNRAYFGFNNTQSDLPAEALLSKQSSSFDADRWPDAPRITAVLARWHRAGDAVQSAWSNVPENLEAGLVPPSQSIAGNVIR